MTTVLAGPVVVIGSGLMGASVGLSLRRAAVGVHLEDADPAMVSLAARVGAGAADPVEGSPALVVVAVPPDHVGSVVVEALTRFPDAPVTDIGSVKVRPLEEVARSAPEGVARYVGSHPMAGSERSGAAAASAELFDGRAWAVTPHVDADPEAVAVVDWLVRRCQAVLVHMSPQEHDEAVARTSHVPHVLAVLAAARLVDAPGAHLQLAGQGLRDVTRVAAGDPGLWRQILTANAACVEALLHEVRSDLDDLIAALTKHQPSVEPLLARGVKGTLAIPGKHGGPVRTETSVFVVVPDQPGELARLFADAGQAGINIEDVHIDHDPGRAAGLVEISVQNGAADALAAALTERGWVAHR